MDSYFGQIGHSFYGGPNGQSFSVKETFSNKVALDADLATGFTSPIQVGEYVIISYGNPHETPVPPETRNQYEINRDLDYNIYSGQTYNATLWQKSFNNETLVYELIVGFETSSPNFVFLTNVQDPGEFDPTINNIEDISTSEITKTFQLSMPDAWNIVRGQVVASNPGDNNNIGVAINRYPGNDGQNESDTIKYIHFTLPKPWDVNIIGNVINADDNPALVVIEPTNVEARKWRLDLPNPWNVQLGNWTVLDPISDPEVTINNITPLGETDHNSKYIYFSLPTTWNIELGSDSSWINPTDFASVLINRKQGASGADSNTTKYAHIKIPNAWNILLGDDSGYVDPIQQAEVSIDRKENSSSEESDTTKYVHITIPNAWDMVLGEDSGWSNPTEIASVSIDRLPGDGTQIESTDTKYIHITIPNAWDIVKANDTIVVNPGTDPNVIIDRYETAGVGFASDTTKYVHFRLPKPWDFALGKVELIYPTSNPEVVVNTESATGVVSLDTKYVHFKLPVAQEFTTDAFSLKVLGPSETANAITWFNGGDTIHQYPKVELSLPRTEKTKFGSAMAYTTNMTISISGATAADWVAIQELAVGDFYVNTTYAGVHKILTKTSSVATTEYLGSMQLAIPTIQGKAVNPYDASGNPVVPNVETSAVGPVSSWNVSVDTVLAPRFNVNTRFIASTESGSSSISFSNSDPTKSGCDTVVYSVQIPRGTRLTAYPKPKPTSSDADPVKNGDLYLDENGKMTSYNVNIPGWEDSVSIKGNNFLIKNKDMTITVTADDINNISGSSVANRIGQYIGATYPNSYGAIKENEILNVNYYPEQDIQTAYWIFKAQNDWTGSKLTGDVSNTIVENTWQTEPLDDKAYSVALINKLLGGATIAEENPNNTIYQLDRRIAALEAAFDLGWGTLPITG